MEKCFHKPLLIVTFSCLIIWLAGCKASPANLSELSGKSEAMQNNYHYPFHKVWIEETVPIQNYNKIYIKPVFIWFMEEQSFREQVNDFMAFSSQTNYVNELSEYFRKQLKEKLRKMSKTNRYSLADHPGPQTLSLQLAIIQVVPTNVVVNSVKILTIPLFLVFPVAIPIKLAINLPLNLFFPSGKVAFEAVFSDSETGQPLFCIADREKTPLKLLHLSDYTIMGHQRKIVEDWAEQIVKSLNKKKGAVIEDTPLYTFWPW